MNMLINSFKPTIFFLILMGFSLSMLEILSVILFSTSVAFILGNNASELNFFSNAIFNVLPFFDKNYVTVFYLFSILISLLFVWIVTYLSNMLGIKLFNNLYRSFLYREYLDYISEPISHYQTILFEEITKVQERFFMTLSVVIHRSFFIIFVFCMILYITPLDFIFEKDLVIYILPLLIIFLGVIYGFFKYSKNLGGHSLNLIRLRFHAVSAVLNSWRRVKLRGAEEESAHEAYQYGRVNARIVAHVFMYGSTSRYLVEIAVLIFLYMFGSSGAIAMSPDTMVLLGALFFRTLPAVSNLLNNLIVFSSSIESVRFIERELAASKENVWDRPSANGLPVRSALSGAAFILRNVSLSLAGKNIFRDLDLELPWHGLVTVTGETGSGKSTLANLLMGFILPDSGDLYYGGRRIDRESRQAVWNEIGLVEQFYNNIDGQVSDNITFSDSGAGEALFDVLFRFDSQEDRKSFFNQKARELSGGEQQRLSLVREFSLGKKVIFLDEFGSGLDAETLGRFLDWLDSNKKDHLFVWVTHIDEVKKRSEIEINLDDI